ncbi:ANTAR domain-containing protein [Streptomyces coeruleorubidus]|nr:ANTAR domain-containing protein [Streptomyces coeruleorubidus]WDV56727.1 ANTAR domain-containing protein [Streptomyces coeruleorubidus]
MLAHARIDQATGVLVALGGITPDEAWDLLREVSMNTNTKLRMVAESLVGRPAGETCQTTCARLSMLPSRPNASTRHHKAASGCCSGREVAGHECAGGSS